ncbi:ACP phosphodiesterase [Morganella psychrotolerans]|uniref:acyl carrier protein phosphodiesterase n=1 Tax=Morganella psychrotolerans TaxID=368603 RepID=UPI0039B00416
MNFLAHLHLASLANSSLLGNLMADFVRGAPEDQYSAAVAQGIRLHRRVDTLTDSHPLVREARQLFRPELRRYAPITLDVVWDHFLSRHWSDIVPGISLTDFTQHVRTVIEPQLAFTPLKFQEMNEFMWPQRWLIRYQEVPYIGQVLAGMARRRPKLVALKETDYDFINNYQPLEDIFFRFYPQMMEAVTKSPTSQ